MEQANVIIEINMICVFGKEKKKIYKEHPSNYQQHSHFNDSIDEVFKKVDTQLCSLVVY